MTDWIAGFAKDVIRDLVVSVLRSGAKKLWVHVWATPSTPPQLPVRAGRFDSVLATADAFLRATARQDYSRARELCYLSSTDPTPDASVARLFGVQPPLSWTFSAVHYSAESTSGEGPQCVGIEGKVTFSVSQSEAEQVSTLFWMVQETACHPWGVYEIEWYFGRAPAV